MWLTLVYFVWPVDEGPLYYCILEFDEFWEVSIFFSIVTHSCIMLHFMCLISSWSGMKELNNFSFIPSYKAYTVSSSSWFSFCIQFWDSYSNFEYNVFVCLYVHHVWGTHWLGLVWWIVVCVKSWARPRKCFL